MIDIEPEVFTSIATALRKKFPKITVLGESLLVPTSFPCVTIEEADNYSLRSTQDSGSNENHARMMYEVNVYTNTKNGSKKTQCKNIFVTVDEVLSNLGFTRTMRNPIKMEDATVYRLIGRFTCIASKENYIFRG